MEHLTYHMFGFVSEPHFNLEAQLIGAIGTYKAYAAGNISTASAQIPTFI
jgi:hypothetical protein